MVKQVTISSKNQITLPSALLRTRRLAPGQKLYIVERGQDLTLTTQSPMDHYLEKALALRQTKPKPKDITDPLKARQELRDDWSER